MKASSGFSLVELMITLAVAAILASLAMPSFRDHVADSRLRSTANDLVSALNLARSEAIKRGVRVAVAYNGSWNGGWVVEVAGDGTDIRVFEALDSPLTLTSAGGFSNFQYRASGLVDNSDTLTLCDDRSGETGRQIVIIATGQARVQTFTCS